MTVKSCVYETADAIADYLVEVMQTLVDQDDPTNARMVRKGNLQDSPLKAFMNVLVQFNDPQDEKGWPHAILNHEIARSIGLINIQPYELGGGEMWLRRYTLELEEFMQPGTGREDAERLAGIILSRAEHALKQAPLPATDDFNETPLQVFLSTSTNIESGGPGQFIFHGRIKFSVLTEKNF